MTLLTPSLISPTTSKLLSYLTFSTNSHDSNKANNSSSTSKAAPVSDDPTLITIVMRKDGTATTKCLNPPPSLSKSATISSALASHSSSTTFPRRRRSSFSTYQYLSSPPKQRRLMISSFIPRFSTSSSTSQSTSSTSRNLRKKLGNNNNNSSSSSRSNNNSSTVKQKEFCSMNDLTGKERAVMGGMVGHPLLPDYKIADTIHSDKQRQPLKRLQLLPSELIIKVILSLDCPSLLNLAHTCKQFYKLCHKNHHYLWQTLFYTDYAISRDLALQQKLPPINYFELYKNHFELNKRWRYGHVQTRYLTGHEDSVYCLAWLGPDHIVSGSRDRSIKVWSLSGSPTTTSAAEATIGHAISSPSVPSLIMTKSYHDGSVLCMRLSSDNTFLVSGSSDATCLVWSLPSFEPMQRLIGHTGGVLDVCIIRDYIISSSRDATIRVWDRKKAMEIRRLEGHAGPVNALGSHGDLVASASGDTTIKLWDIHTGHCLRTFTGHTRGLACIKFDGKYIYSGGQDNKFKVWDAHTGHCVATLPGHTDLIRTIDSFENLVVSGSYDRTLRVWDSQQKKCILSFQSGHSSWIFNCLVNRTKIISAGQDKRIMVLDFGFDLVTLQ
ncbi:WD40-repeat-containing domain protein [Mycotypha africana]|uniref:WD40-repeat-containing domain protein n=1 Tax=Mycotypha africana TaxID=64632 RepID=UPI0023000015|nr:WD40-repeat-containing domain protein [Mycotypha africana]KAI8984353.1 WD40-repeat-containing domain protein [Mycotypha africana]